MELGEQIATLREEQALTQAELAEAARISPSTLSQIESGRVPSPHVGTVRKIARALGVEPAELRRAKEPVPLGKAPREAGASPNEAIYEKAIEEYNERRYGPSIIAQDWDRMAERWTQRLEEGDFDQRELEILVETLEYVAVGMQANAEAERKLLVDSYGTEAARDMSLLRPAINRLGLLVGEILKILEEGNGEASGVPHKPEMPDEEMPDETVVPFPDRFQKEAS